MATSHFYPVGTAGTAWGETEKAAWFALADDKKRSYADEVVAKLEALKATLDVEQYGALSMDPARYPVFVIKSRHWDPSSKPCVLVTGGVHGYETSGVQGALLFASTHMADYAMRYNINIAVVPCVSPWGYECVQRWNAKALDPNRYFVQDSPVDECALVVQLVEGLAVPAGNWLMHMDLHETTDSDDFEFRPAKASRDGLPLAEESIPDGFYLIGNRDLPQKDWHAAVIDAVRGVTHIAPPDANNQIVELDVAQAGVVNSKSVGKGKGVTGTGTATGLAGLAQYATTTEVYPDSKVTRRHCSHPCPFSIPPSPALLILTLCATPSPSPSPAPN
jgi:hypothetical protein